MIEGSNTDFATHYITAGRTYCITLKILGLINPLITCQNFNGKFKLRMKVVGGICWIYVLFDYVLI